MDFTADEYARRDADRLREILSGPPVTWAFLGDSITQAGGYVGLVTYYLEKLHPDKNFDVLGLGPGYDVPRSDRSRPRVKPRRKRNCGRSSYSIRRRWWATREPKSEPKSETNPETKTPETKSESKAAA